MLARPSPVLFLCLFASQAALLVLSPILPDVARAFDVSIATAGQLRSLSGLTGGLTAVALALAPRRPGLRTLLSAGAGLVAIASGLSAVAPSFAVLLGAQAVLGVGIGLLVAVGIAAAFEWAPPAERAHVLAWAIAGMPAAWIAGMPVVGLLLDLGWRATFAVPACAALATLVVVRLRPADAPSRRAPAGMGLARFTVAELLANAAWASVLTYAGALVLESYDVSPLLVTVGLGAMAAAMLPGTFAARRSALHATPVLLSGLTVVQGVSVIALGTLRPHVAATLAVLALMAFVNGWRSMVASALGMDSAPEDRLAVMSMRAAANQFGYLLGAALGGLALALGGFPAVGTALGAMFLAAALIHVVRAPRLAPAALRAQANGSR